MMQHLREAIDSFLYKFWLWIFNINLAAVFAWVVEWSPTILTVLTASIALSASYVRLKRERVELELKEMDLEDKRQERQADHAEC